MFVVIRVKSVFARPAAVLASTMLAFGGFALPVLAQSDDQVFTERTTADKIPSELLQDGLDALAENANNLAAQLFGQVIAEFPNSPEADRAKQELVALGRASQQPEASALPRNRDDVTALRIRFAIEAGDRVFFAENSAVIGGRARALLENQGRWLASRPELRIMIIGRADDGGQEDAAHILSAKRAEAVRDKLVTGGIAASRIVIDARGTLDPIATCRTAVCQAQNRHAETSIGSAVATGAGDDDVYRGKWNSGRGATVSGTGSSASVSR